MRYLIVFIILPLFASCDRSGVRLSSDLRELTLRTGGLIYAEMKWISDEPMKTGTIDFNQMRSQISGYEKDLDRHPKGRDYDDGYLDLEQGLIFMPKGTAFSHGIYKLK